MTNPDKTSNVIETAQTPSGDLSRRDALGSLLKFSVLGAAVAAAPSGAKTLAGALSGKKVMLPVLAADGRVVQVDARTLEAMKLPPSNPAARIGVPGKKWIMVIDLAKCDGCGKCMEACGKMHFIPPGRQWLKVLLQPGEGGTAPYFFPQPCYQCDNPPCTKVCPVDATFKRQDGIVLVDNDRCIGCRFCMAACPYGARSFNWGKPEDPAEAKAREYSPEWGYPRKVGTVEKCDFCPEMAAAGKLPPCTQSCPMDAIYYGDENEDAVTCASGQTLQLSKLLTDGAAYRHLEELGTKPRVYYLPPRARMYPPPVIDEKKPGEMKMEGMGGMAGMKTEGGHEHS